MYRLRATSTNKPVHHANHDPVWVDQCRHMGLWGPEKDYYVAINYISRDETIVLHECKCEVTKLLIIIIFSYYSSFCLLLHLLTITYYSATIIMIIKYIILQVVFFSSRFCRLNKTWLLTFKLPCLLYVPLWKGSTKKTWHLNQTFCAKTAARCNTDISVT